MSEESLLRLRKLSEDIKINGQWVSILNVLSLLREKPMTYEELMKSGCFKTQGRLSFTLYRLQEAECLEKIQSAKIYVILGHGLSLLSFYPTWHPLPIEVLDIVACMHANFRIGPR